MIHEVGNVELCEPLDKWNPKRSAKYVYHTGTSASSNARAGTSCETEQRVNKKFVLYTIDLFDCQLLHKGRTA